VQSARTQNLKPTKALNQSVAYESLTVIRIIPYSERYAAIAGGRGAKEWKADIEAILYSLFLRPA